MAFDVAAKVAPGSDLNGAAKPLIPSLVKVEWLNGENVGRAAFLPSMMGSYSMRAEGVSSQTGECVVAYLVIESVPNILSQVVL